MQLANVILFLTMALVFTFLGYVNRARLSANFGIEGLDVIINVVILLTIMLAVGFTGVVNLKPKKAQLNTNIQP